MSRAIIDIDELYSFISSFGTICGSIREQKEHINGKFRDLNEVWQDARYTEFEKNFTDTVKEIDTFLQYSEAYSDYLQRKGRRAQEYLQG